MTSPVPGVPNPGSRPTLNPGATPDDAGLNPGQLAGIGAQLVGGAAGVAANDAADAGLGGIADAIRDTVADPLKSAGKTVQTISDFFASPQWILRVCCGIMGIFFIILALWLLARQTHSEGDSSAAV